MLQHKSNLTPQSWNWTKMGLASLCFVVLATPSKAITSSPVGIAPYPTIATPSKATTSSPVGIVPYPTISDFPCYKNLQGSFDWMNDMVLRARSIPGLIVTKQDIGDSYLKSQNKTAGHDIWVLMVTGTPRKLPSTKKAVLFIMAGIHPREYAPPELASRWVESLIWAYGKDADITAMLNYTEIHLLLQSNPDGRQVAETETDRATLYKGRRKNLNPNSGSCEFRGLEQGVDLNRNFPFHWGLDSGSGSDECTPDYRGLFPGSEPEVKAIVQYTKSIFPVAQRKVNPTKNEQVPYAESSTMGVFLSIHSFGGMIDQPWTYSMKGTGNNQAFLAMFRKLQHFTGYTPYNYENTTVSGGSSDYAYGLLGAASFVFEVGDKFYQDCNTFEDSILQRNLKAFSYLAKISKAPYSLAKGPDVMKLSTTVNGNILTVAVAASDYALSYTAVNESPVSTAKQKIRWIRVYLDRHPYSVPAKDAGTESALLNTPDGSLTMDISSLAAGSRHVVYAQAEDSDGYKGPVTAAYFDAGSYSVQPTVVPSTSSAPSIVPSKSSAPSVVPSTFAPSAA